MKELVGVLLFSVDDEFAEGHLHSLIFQGEKQGSTWSC